MDKFNKKAFDPIDEEEKKMMESIEKEEWIPVNDFEMEKGRNVAILGYELAYTLFHGKPALNQRFKLNPMHLRQ